MIFYNGNRYIVDYFLEENHTIFKNTAITLLFISDLEIILVSLNYA